MRPSLEERETHISIGRLDSVAQIYTSDERYMTKCDKLVKENPDEWKFVRQEMHEGDIVGKFYECPANLISLRSKTITGRQGQPMTEEMKQKLREGREKRSRNRF